MKFRVLISEIKNVCGQKLGHLKNDEYLILEGEQIGGGGASYGNLNIGTPGMSYSPLAKIEELSDGTGFSTTDLRIIALKINEIIRHLNKQ